MTPPAWVSDWAVWLAAVVAGLTALGWLTRKTWRFIKKARAKARALGEKFDTLVELIDHEMKPNSGASLRDAIDRTEKSSAGTAKALAEHITASESERADLRNDFSQVKDGFEAVLTSVARLEANSPVRQDDTIATLAKAIPEALAATAAHTDKPEE